MDGDDPGVHHADVEGGEHDEGEGEAILLPPLVDAAEATHGDQGGNEATSNHEFANVSVTQTDVSLLTGVDFSFGARSAF